MARTITQTQNYRTEIRPGTSAPPTVVVVPAKGDSGFKRFEDLARKLTKVPKAELDKERQTT